MEFLTTGQKIKKIRKILNLNQEELVTDGITRPFISMLESGKRRISNKNAKILAESFNKRAKKLNIELCVDPNYILNTPSEDASKYCLEKLANTKYIADIEDIIKISSKFNLEDISAKAYHRLGDLYFEIGNYRDAFEKYITVLDIFKSFGKKKLYADLYNILGKCKMKLLQYHDALFYFQRANHYSITYSNSTIQRLSLYNLGLCLKKINKIDNALIYINEFITMCDKDINFKEYIYANILICTCYETQNNIDKALDVYNGLIPKFSNQQDPLLAMIYSNLGSIYLKNNDCVKSLDYYNLAQKIRTDKDVYNLHRTIIQKADVFIKQNFYDEAIILIKLGLEMASKYNDLEYLIKGNYRLAQVYTNLNDYINLENIYIHIIYLLKDTKNDEQILKIYNYMSIMYLKQNNLDKVENCLKMSQKILGNSYNYSL
ncbi:helix-turn-helix domain-containing protein [Clostridium sp.]|uniref:helix-turn-helix domain-containing protein n=1 Tax=Clostridium sp. TaxID=1506 RepID=UPI001A411CE8|nr:tetratricopeptide repeat protein [Clostridium sp.]MBK5242435.1 tetratricopeptide repeat protein [Clostridium sp.]